jgi:D-aminopeptidase
MICHEFKAGIGTASRRAGDSMVGVLVQANYGERELLRIDGVPVGAAISREDVPSPWDQVEALGPRAGVEGGSIIGIVATDAPLLPHQCARLAQRVGMGVARMGSYASHGSGDLFCAFATGNRDLSRNAGEGDPRPTVALRMVTDGRINPLLEAVAEATEEAIVNALLGAQTMVGRDGITAHAIDHDRLVEIMHAHGRTIAPYVA